MSIRSTLSLLALTMFSSAIMAQAPDFPEGPGKPLFTQYCGACHDINRSRAGYSPDGWRMVVRMMQNMEVPVPKDQWGTLTDYLIKSFPERSRPAAVIVDGPQHVAIKMWPVSTVGSRPHDPAAARDGSLWYTGQTANTLGRVDPKTGQIREYKLKTPHSGPHGLKEDKEGNIWFTANHATYIGRLDPKTGNVTEYPLDKSVKDPHTLAIAQNGMVWFTAQNGNVVGRVNPATREVKVVTVPTPKSRPYGILINSKGVPVYVAFGTNKIATVDPQTMAIKEYNLPDAKSRPRRLALEGDDIVWYADYSRGYLGRLNLATGEHKEWPSPSGSRSLPYGMVLTKGALWYNESGAKPNTIVRFDPKTEKFQTWAIPGGGDIVRNMDVMPDGNPVMANSLVNQVGVVEIK